MKKYLSMICCLAVLFTAGCGDDDTGGEDGPKGEAKLIAFSFTAESNPDCLVKDYTGTISGTAVSVKVPAGTDVSALVATFETADGESTVTVGGTPQVSGTTANDFSDPVDYLVNLGKKNALYTVTVSELPEAVWTKVTELEMEGGNNILLEIDPTDNKPALAISTKDEGDLLYAKITGSTISPVIAQEKPASQPSFGFSKSGQPYIMYYNSTEKFNRITTFTNNSWKLQDITIDRPLVNTGTGPTICDIDNKIFFFTSNNAASGAIAKRGHNITIFDGSQWYTQQTIPGRSGYTYYPVARVVNDIMYVLMLNPVSPNSFSIYTYKNGTWTTVVDSFAYTTSEEGATPTYYGIGSKCPDMAIDNDKNIYVGLSYKLGIGYRPHVMKFTYNEQTNTYEEGNRLGRAIETTSGDFCKIALSPIGIPYVAYLDSDTEKVMVASLDNKTKDWGTPTSISSDMYTTDFVLKFAKDGTAYLVYGTSDTAINAISHKISLYKLATAE